MKNIMIKYNVEIPQEDIDKICKYCNCGRRDVEVSIIDKAELAGRLTINDFVKGFIIINKKGEE